MAFKARGSGNYASPCRPHNPATGFRPPSATMVSAEPFSHGTGTLRCLRKEMATYRHWSVSLWRNPDDVSHCRILSPDKTEWRLISATLCGWRRCLVADQLWLMKRIREEEDRVEDHRLLMSTMFGGRPFTRSWVIFITEEQQNEWQNDHITPPVLAKLRDRSLHLVMVQRGGDWAGPLPSSLYQM